MRANREFDLREQIADIDRDRAEARKLEVEARQLDEARHVEIERALSKTRKYAAEQRKLEAEARQFDRQHWQTLVAVLTASAALFAAGAAFIKLLT